MRLKKTVLLLVLLLAAMLLGGLLAAACAEVPGLSWLAFSRQVGISPDAPFELNLSFMRFSFGFSIHLSVAQVLAMVAAVLLHGGLAKKL